MALVLNGSGSITGVTDLATAGVALEDAALTDPVVTGGIYLGGTGAANYLDDYEEGTWTPAYTPQTGAFASITYDPARQGSYTKIGNIVSLRMFMRTDAISVGTASGFATITGLPFAPANGYNAAGIYATGFTGDNPDTAIAYDDNVLYLYYRTAANGQVDVLDVSDLGLSSNDNTLRLSITYQTS
jgi:hypothetical protein